MASLLYPELYKSFLDGVNPKILTYGELQGNCQKIVNNFFLNAHLVESHQISEYSDLRWLSVYKLDKKNQGEYSNMRIAIEILEGSCNGCACSKYYSDGTYVDEIMSKAYIDTAENVDEYVAKYTKYNKEVSMYVSSNREFLPEEYKEHALKY